jgi:EmrB/QacA subfamily drug resistance transporter
MNNLEVSLKQQPVLSLVSEKMVVMIAGIGMFLSTLDTGIINVALPFLEKEFHSSVTTIAWSVTIYMMALSGTIILFGKLSDRIGRLKISLLGFGIFMLSSILCGSSLEIGQLILFRAFQGVGAAALQATSAAFLTTLIKPERRNHALGTLGVMIGLGPIFGPTVGGFFISLGSWRWIFWINIPFCLVGLWACYRLSKAIHEQTYRHPIDMLGNVCFTMSSLLFLWGISMASKEGLTSISTIGSVILSIILIGLFAFQETKVDYPIVHANLFRNSTFLVPIFATTGFGFASAVVFIVPPYFLDEITRLTPWQTGFVLLSAPLGLVILSRISGKYINRFGRTRLMLIGLGIMLAAFIGLSFMQAQWSIFLLAFLLFLYGVGGGIFQPANIGSVMGAVSTDQQGTISAVQRMVQNIAIAFGASVAAAFMNAQVGNGNMGLIHAFQFSWFAAGGLLILNLLAFTVYRKPNK